MFTDFFSTHESILMGIELFFNLIMIIYYNFPSLFNILDIIYCLIILLPLGMKIGIIEFNNTNRYYFQLNPLQNLAIKLDFQHQLALSQS